MEANKKGTGLPGAELTSYGLTDPKQTAPTDSAVELTITESSTIEPTEDKVATPSETHHETSNAPATQELADYEPSVIESIVEDPVIPAVGISDPSTQESLISVAADDEQVTNDPPAIRIDSNDTDSAFGEDTESETSTLKSSITAYRVENGRRYHAYKDGAYWAPNDDLQNEQLDIAHHLHTMILDGALHLAPIGNNPQRVLDLGTGTGIWAIDFADMYPSASVIGTDLSPIQPSWVPPNVKFEIEDFTDEWTFKPNEFDFIHIRSLYGSVGDWPKFYEQAYKHLKPGYWIEQFEISIELHSDDGSIVPGSALARFGSLFHEASEIFGKSLNVAAKMKKYMDEVGFVNTVEKVWKAPIRGWAADPKLKELGHWGLLELEVGLEGFAMALMTRALGWDYTEVQAFLGQVRTELHSKNIHAYHYVYVVYGQKPEP